MPSSATDDSTPHGSVQALRLNLKGHDSTEDFASADHGAAAGPDDEAIGQAAVVALIDQALASHLQNELKQAALTPLNLRIDWTGFLQPQGAVQIAPRLLLHDGGLAIGTVDVCQEGCDQPVGHAVTRYAPAASTAPTVHQNAQDTRVAGIIAAHMDSAARHTLVQTGFSQGAWFALDLWVEFIRPAMLTDAFLEFQATPQRVGRTLASIRILAKSEASGEIIAMAGAKFIADNPAEKPPKQTAIQPAAPTAL